VDSYAILFGRDEIDEAAAQVAEPTDAQKEAGNYRKGHVVVQGLPITIETAKGMVRSGTDDKGNRWSVTMGHHYGYIKRTESDADGDHIDVFIGPNPDSDVVYIVDQVGQDGKFDEHKCMVGFNSKQDAINGYKSCYSKGWKVGEVTPLTMDQFQRWIHDGDTGKPFAAQKNADGTIKYSRFSWERAIPYRFSWDESLQPRADDGKFSSRNGAILFGRDGWVTIGGNKSAPKGEKGGTPVYIEDGKVTKGPSSLKGRDVDNLQNKERQGPPKPSQESKPKKATISIKKAKGYDRYGSLGKESYLAKITGLDGSGKFDRSYQKTENIDWGDSQLYKKSKGTWTEIHDVDDGIYEAVNHGDYDYYLIVDGEKFEASTKDIKWVASQLNSGRSFADSVKKTGDGYQLVDRPKTWDDFYDVADATEYDDTVKSYRLKKDGSGISIEFIDGNNQDFSSPKDAIDHLLAIKSK